MVHGSEWLTMIEVQGLFNACYGNGPTKVDRHHLGEKFTSKICIFREEIAHRAFRIRIGLDGA